MVKWILIAAAILIVVGGGVWLLASDDDSESTNSVSQSDTTPITEESIENTSVNALLARGESMKCTYDYTDADGNQSLGEAYFSNGKMFGDFTNRQANGETVQSNVINTGDTQYVWQKESKEGYKTDISNVTDEEAQQKDEALDPDENYEFKCVALSVDSSMFEIPSDVKFIDISAQLEQVQSEVQGATQAACAQITNAQARAACEEAF